jgi:methionyl-tRNA synthetase
MADYDEGCGVMDKDTGRPCPGTMREGQDGDTCDWCGRVGGGPSLKNDFQAGGGVSKYEHSKNCCFLLLGNLSGSPRSLHKFLSR